MAHKQAALPVPCLGYRPQLRARAQSIETPRDTKALNRICLGSMEHRTRGAQGERPGLLGGKQSFITFAGCGRPRILKTSQGATAEGHSGGRTETRLWMLQPTAPQISMQELSSQELMLPGGGALPNQGGTILGRNTNSPPQFFSEELYECLRQARLRPLRRV